MNHHPAIERLEARIAPAGIVLAVYDPVTDELTLTGDDLDNSVSVFQTSPTTWRVEGKDDAALVKTSINEVGIERLDIGAIAKLTIATAGGNDRVDLINLRGLISLTVDTGAGNDTVKTNGLIVKGNASFSTGAGADTVELDGLVATISGNLGIADGGDGLTFTFGAAASTVAGSVTYQGSAGIDVLTMETDTRLKIGKHIEFTANGGNDRLQFGSQGTVSIGRDLLGHSIVYHGGSGNDRIGIGASGVAILGSVEMSGANGNDTLDIDGLKVAIGKSVAGLSVHLDGGQGLDQIDLQGSTLTVAGLVRLDGGTEADTLDLTGVHRLSLLGGARFDGGAGADEFKIGADLLAITGTVQFDGGADADVAEIEGDGTIRGAVALLLGDATSGAQTADVHSRSGLPAGLKITGALTIDATGIAGTTDSLKLTNLNVGGLLAVTLGEGASSVDLDNLNTAAAVNIQTRGGDDDVQIERDATFGVSTFRMATTIDLGIGTDSLFIGKDSKNNRVLFLGSLTADGGTGTDSRNDIAVDNKFTPPASYIESGFEVLVLPPV